MTATSPIVLAGSMDHTSFIVPSLAFTNAADATQSAANRDYLNDLTPSAPHHVFSSVNVGPKVYVPRISSVHQRWHADQLLTGKGGLEETRWELLRSKAKPQPFIGAFNVCLLVDGPRQYSLNHPFTHKRSSLWYKIHDGERDSFAVWGRVNGEPFGRHEVLDGKNHVVASRHGRGVLFACTARFSDDGKPTGFTTRMIKLEFSVEDSDIARDDMVMVKILRHVSHGDVDDGPYNWARNEEDSGWRILVERAQQGFAQFCRTVPEEVDDCRKLFIDQKALLEDDKLVRDGTSYRDQVKAISWQQALDNVVMPWQLQVVIDVHCGPGDFEDSQHRYGTISTRVRNMLGAHLCTDSRRSQLQAMVDSFIRTNEKLWNWSGD